MKDTTRHCCLLLVSLLIVSGVQLSNAQKTLTKIDRVNSADDVENLLSTVDKKRFDMFYVQDPLRFGDASCTAYANSLKARSWTKADFDGNGLTDLLILGDAFGPASIVLLDTGKNHFDVHILSQSKCSVPVVEFGGPPNAIILDTKKLVFKFGNFVEENLSPRDHKIERIEYDRHGCFGECPAFKFDIKSDRNTEFVAVAFNKGKKGKFRTKLNSVTYDQLVSLLNYINFVRLDNDYSTGATDLAGAKLTITYDGGKVKNISDYGFRGPFGLQAVHQKFLELRENQHWNR
jgi:hypothetical protein